MASTAAKRSSTGAGTGWPHSVDKQKLHSSNSITIERAINL